MTPPTVVQSYKSYAVTVRPRDGVTSDQIVKFMKWVRKVSTYYFVVTEGETTGRHIHAGVFLAKAMSRSNFSTALVRQFPELDNDEARILRTGVRIQYDINFIETYLAKDEEVVLISSNLPEIGKLEGFWPPAREQAKAKAAKAVDKYYANLEFHWNESRGPSHEPTKDNCLDFVFEMMFKKRLIRSHDDDRKLKRVALTLRRYLLKMDKHDIEWSPWE